MIATRLALGLLTLLALAATSCLSRGHFRCDDDRQCTRAGRRGFCEAGQVCSFEDPSCELGRRYASYADEAGALADRCVEPKACQGTPVVEVQAGGEHACYRRLDGRIACWGRNDFGQLGDGTSTPHSTPVSVVGLVGPARAVALGTAFSCAIDQDTRVQCWGQGDSGQLGTLNDEIAAAGSPRPLAVPGLSGALELALGGAFACVRAVDGISCWGANDQGQRGGDGGMTLPVASAAVTPVLLPLPPEQLVVGQAHACARLRDGGVACWGDGRRGQLGTGDVISQPRPVRISGLEGVVELSAGGAHTCARLRDGSLSCWGDDSAGQLGGELATPAADGLVARPTPVAKVAMAAHVRAGARHTCAVLPDETVVCFGDPGRGRLGTAAAASGAVTGVHQVLGLAVGGGFSCALERDATIRCWGEDGHGQLGAGGAISRMRPSPVPVLDNAQAVSARGRTTCVLRAGEISCFGAGEQGALGNGQTDDQSTPVPVRVPAGVIEIATGAFGSCGRTLDRQVWCWGSGVGLVPALRAGLTAVDGIAAGRAHACALSRGRVLCWGENRHGQLGQSPSDGQAESATVPLAAVIVEIAAGADHTCARGEGGQIYCWGRGDEGQLGEGRLVSSFTPTAVALPGPVRALSGGGGHSCALLGDGQVSCWGRNREGQVNGVAGPPVPVPTPTWALSAGAADAVAAGGRFTCVLHGGAVTCVGRTAAADSAAGAAPSGPHTIALTGAAAAVAAGGEHACVIDTAGALRCFGLDASGQLGTGRPLSSAWPRPVAIACP